MSLSSSRRADLLDRLDVLLIVRGRGGDCSCGWVCFVRWEEVSEVEDDWEMPKTPEELLAADPAWPTPSTPRGTSDRLMASKTSTQSSKSSSVTVVKPCMPSALLVGR